MINKLYKSRKKQFQDIAQFGRAMILSGDVDPQFPALRNFYKALGLDKNTAIWWTAVYLAYYHLGSAIKGWEAYPKPEHIRKKDWVELFYFKQRRCFRGNTHARDQLNELLKVSDGNLVGWTDHLVGDGGEEGWTRVREAAASLPYHGPWSSYKWADLIRWVHQYPITAPDIGNKPGSTAGPIAGLTSLTGLDWRRCSEDNQLHRNVMSCIIDLGCPLAGLDHLESLCCDYQSIINGRYYNGHDIDRDLKQLQGSQGEYSKLLWRVRYRTFDYRLLGEFGGWSEPRSPLKTAYKTRGMIVNDFPDVKVVEL